MTSCGKLSRGQPYGWRKITHIELLSVVLDRIQKVLNGPLIHKVPQSLPPALVRLLVLSLGEWRTVPYCVRRAEAGAGAQPRRPKGRSIVIRMVLPLVVGVVLTSEW